MNSAAILSVFCILFVWAVESSYNDKKICDLTENDEGLKVLVDCFNEHMPPFIPKLVKQCYEEGFKEPGTLGTYVAKVCKAEEHQDGIIATITCMRGKMEQEMEAAGFTEDDMINSAKQTEECLLASAGDDESSKELEEAIDEFAEAIEKADESEEPVEDIAELVEAIDEFAEAIEKADELEEPVDVPAKEIDELVEAIEELDEALK